MIPVMQKALHPTKGDCLRACVASLLNKNINEVPNFTALFPDDNVNFGYWELFYYWMWHHGYLIETHDDIRDIEDDYEGINGYTIVSVMSTLKDKSHACIYSIKDKKIAHDPDPEQLVMKLSMPIEKYYKITRLDHG